MHTLGLVNAVWVFQFDKWVCAQLPLQPCLSCKMKKKKISLALKPSPWPHSLQVMKLLL